MARLERELGWLPMGVAPVAPRAGLHPADWRPRCSTGRAGGRSLLAARPWPRRRCCSPSDWGGRDSAERRVARAARRLAAREQRLMALEDTLSVLRRRQHGDRRRNISMNGHEQGGLLIFQRRRLAPLVRHGARSAAGAGGEHLSVLVHHRDRHGALGRGRRRHATRPAFMTLPMPGVAAPVMGAALTVEPAVNRSSEPQGMHAGACDVLGRLAASSQGAHEGNATGMQLSADAHLAERRETCAAGRPDCAVRLRPRRVRAPAPRRALSSPSNPPPRRAVHQAGCASSSPPSWTGGSGSVSVGMTTPLAPSSRNSFHCACRAAQGRRRCTSARPAACPRVGRGSRPRSTPGPACRSWPAPRRRRESRCSVDAGYRSRWRAAAAGSSARPAWRGTWRGR